MWVLSRKRKFVGEVLLLPTCLKCQLPVRVSGNMIQVIEFSMFVCLIVYLFDVRLKKLICGPAAACGWALLSMCVCDWKMKTKIVKLAPIRAVRQKIAHWKISLQQLTCVMGGYYLISIIFMQILPKF